MASGASPMLAPGASPMVTPQFGEADHSHRPTHIASPFLSPYLPVISIRQTPTIIAPLKMHRDRKKLRQRKKKKKISDIVITKRLSKRQWMVYLLYCVGFFSLGLFTSAPGPILKNFEEQVGVSLSIISFIFTARAIGFVIGSFTSAYVLETYQKFIISTRDPNDPSKFKYLPKKNESTSSYLQSLPLLSWPLSTHNVFSISLIIAGITMFLTPYANSVYLLALLVTINGICFGNVNTFGNVCLLTLFDTELDPTLNHDIIYGKDNDDEENEERSTHDGINEKDKLIESPPSYGSLDGAPEPDMADDTMMRLKKQDERVGPFMQGLQAIYALGGFLAPLMIEISFEMGNSYKYAFFFMTLIFIPNGIALFFYPTPVRMSVISKILKEIQFQNISIMSIHSVNDANASFAVSEPDILDEITEKKRKKLKIGIVIGFAVFLCWYVGAQVGYGMYITTYAIDYLHTSASTARLLASANWFGLFVGRFAAIPLSKHLSALNMVGLDLIGMFIGCFILFFSAESIIIVWVSSVSVGFCMASVWPSMFVWAESLITVSGTFASIMVGGGSLGEFLIPAAQGNIMAFYGSKYFTNVMFAMAIFLIINLMINNIMAKRLKSINLQKLMINITTANTSTTKK